MSCSGLHCAGCAGGGSAPVLAFAVFYGVDWVVTHLVEVIATSAACGVLAVAAVVVLMRWADRRDARHAGSLLITRAEAVPLVTARVTPPAVQPAAPPAIENHYHVHYHAADGSEPARVRTMLPGQAGDAITGRES